MAGLDADAARAERLKLLAHSDPALQAIDPKAPADVRAKQIEDALDTQMLHNALDAESYVSPGAIRGVVLGRSLNATSATRR